MCHNASDNHFSLWSNFLFYIFLKPPQHEGLEDEMKSFKLMLVQLSLVH